MSHLDGAAEGLSIAERQEESRETLRAAAAANERRNRPAYLVAVAVLLLLACVLSLAWSLVARGAAAGEFAREKDTAMVLARAVGRLKELQATGDAEGDKGAAPNDQILTMIQGAAERAGIQNPKQLFPRGPGTPENRSGGVQRVRFDYDQVRNESLEPLLLWMRYATESVPGLEVYSVKLRPEANEWVMQVTFQRWQRAGA